MTPFKTQAHIHSLKGEMDEMTVLEKVGENDYIVDYKGVKCHALFNWFVCQFYADNIDKWLCNKIMGFTNKKSDTAYLARFSRN